MSERVTPEREPSWPDETFRNLLRRSALNLSESQIVGLAILVREVVGKWERQRAPAQSDPPAPANKEKGDGLPVRRGASTDNRPPERDEPATSRAPVTQEWCERGQHYFVEVSVAQKLLAALRPFAATVDGVEAPYPEKKWELLLMAAADAVAKAEGR